MICLDDTDTLEGGASVDAVVDYTVHGLVGSTFTVLGDGQLSDTDPSILVTAGAATSIVSITLVNTHSAAVNVNLYLDSADGGNPRRMIPKDYTMDIGSSLHFDGQRATPLLAAIPYSRIIWRMATNETAGDQDPLGGGGADWEISDDTENEAQLGNTVVTESNGIFTFTSTGYWSIRAYGGASNGLAAEDRARLQIKSTDDNNTYNIIAEGAVSFITGRWGNPSTEALIKVSDITLNKVKLAVDVGDPNTEFQGSGAYNLTYIVFTKLAGV